ncbi:tubulin-folding cofactor E [Coffea arabica]|uniref:Tubulin-folding cofactor E n=1 Tax=Coffea arabica TaxID=13443 RepID=A0A6P6UP23_COFAR|nr:tubulin-folding cofactor E-like [Coffea arabica]
MQTTKSSDLPPQPTREESQPGATDSASAFKCGQRVHSTGDTRRIGTVKYVGPVEGYSGTWVGVDWDDDGQGKHDGSHNGVQYFQARGLKTASFVRPHNLSSGITLLEALQVRYRGTSTKEEEDEMYVLSSTNKRVSIELLGKEKIQNKLSRFEELTGVSLSFLGVSSPGPSGQISNTLPNLKQLDLTGNLLSDWKDVGIICKELPALEVLNLSHSSMLHDTVEIPKLHNIRILVLNHIGINWKQVEMLKDSVPCIEELHLIGNNIKEITLSSSMRVEGFDYLHLLNLEENCLADWNEIMKLSKIKSLEQLLLNKNSLNEIWYPEHSTSDGAGNESVGRNFKPFQSLHCLLLGGNNIKDLASVDSLNSFPSLIDIRLSENPVSDTGKDGVPRFVLIARLANVKILNGSEVSPRERKDSEIRYVRLVMTKYNDNVEELMRLHPRFAELKRFHGIEDVKAPIGVFGPQKMSSGLISVTLKCVGSSIGEKQPLTKKLPSTTTVGKLKNLCESFFKLKSVKPKLFLQEEGTPLPTLLDDDMASLMEIGVGNDSTILVDEVN